MKKQLAFIAVAYTYLNNVRARAAQPALSGLDYAAFQKAVRDERGRELAFEALRKYDLVRWGIYVKSIHDDLGEACKDARWTNGTVMTNLYGGVSAYASRTTDKHQFLPIPERELAVNGLLDQNSYWGGKTE